MKVAGRSMVPAFSPAQRVMVSRLSYVLKKPQKGHVVVLRHPQSGTFLLKRVVAGEGERVRQQYGRLFVGPRSVPVSAKDYAAARGESEWVVPKGHYFLAGDNLHASTDSRHFGCVPASAIEGRVIASFTLDE